MSSDRLVVLQVAVDELTARVRDLEQRVAEVMARAFPDQSARVIGMPRPERPAGRDLQKLADEYNRGVSIRTLAGLRGWSYGFTHSTLRLAATQGLTTMRPRGARGPVT